MRLSKQHKIYGAVLGLALAALGADRCFGTSVPAEAGESADVAVAVESATPAKRAAVVGAAPKGADHVAASDRRAISARLDELAQTAGLDVTAVRDAFTPSNAWVPAASVGHPGDERAKRFVADHKLTAVMDGRHAVAIVDGKALRPGQTLDGFKLVTVSARDSKATFERVGGGQVELRSTEVAVAQAK